MHQIGHLLKLY